MCHMICKEVHVRHGHTYVMLICGMHTVPVYQLRYAHMHVARSRSELASLAHSLYNIMLLWEILMGNYSLQIAQIQLFWVQII